MQYYPNIKYIIMIFNIGLNLKNLYMNDIILFYQNTVTIEIG
jgi:hypothetical protein